MTGYSDSRMQKRALKGPRPFVNEPNGNTGLC